MRSTAFLFIAAVIGLPAQTRFARDVISVAIDGQPFAEFHYGEAGGKPYLAPIRSASGKVITRHYPMEQIPGESRDHIHHTGLSFTYDDVNGIKFWANDPSYKDAKAGRVVVRSAEFKDKSNILTAVMEWRDPAGKILLVENRDMTFSGDAKSRTIDFRITLTAGVNITFGDTKEGSFSIRLADSFTEKKGMVMTNAEGLTGMKNVWGKRSSWVDYVADVDGERIGVAMLDHPSNPRHPTYWHARDYGLFSLNPFGRNAFDSNQEESQWKLPAGQKLTFRWRVTIHPPETKIADIYKAYESQ